MRLREAECVHCGESSRRPVNPKGNWLCLECGKSQREAKMSASKSLPDSRARFPQLEFEL